MILLDEPRWPAHGRLWGHLVSDADLAELIAYAAHRLEIHRIIIPSANLAGTTNPTGIEVIGVSRINELLDQ